MSTQIVVKSIAPSVLEDAEKQGRCIYESNPNFQHLADLMENPVFQQVYKNHFRDWTSLQVIVMFFNLYSEIEQKSTVRLTPHQKLFFTKRLFENADLRPHIVHEFQPNPLNNNNGKCVSIK